MGNNLRTWVPHLSLRRIVTSNRYVPEIDGFRCLAIFLVCMAHVYFQCGPIPERGVFGHLVTEAFSDGVKGVLLSFTISGFVVCLPLARHRLTGGSKVRLGSYFRRRVTRLEPPYVASLLLRVIALVAIEHVGFAKLAGHLLATLFYAHSLVFGAVSTISPPAWSLEVEAQFYIVAPLMAEVFLIRSKTVRRGVLIALMLITGMVATLAIDPHGRLALALPYFLQYFLGGLLLGDLYLCEDQPKMPRWAWDAVGAGVVVWMLYSRSRWYAVELPFATIALFMAGFYGGACRWFFSSLPVRLTGGMIYSIYLTHSTVLTALTPLVHRFMRIPLPLGVQYAGIFGGCGVVVCAVAMVFFVLIERPCMDPGWPGKLGQWLRETRRRWGLFGVPG